MNRPLKPWRAGITRRKAITIFAVSAALVAAGRGSANARLYEWTGIALGADARILLSTSDPEAARASIEAAMAEVARLEAIFSLFDENSELVRLNRDKSLPQPSQDMRRLIALCRTVHAADRRAVRPLGPAALALLLRLVLERSAARHATSG